MRKVEATEWKDEKKLTKILNEGQRNTKVI